MTRHIFVSGKTTSLALFGEEDKIMMSKFLMNAELSVLANGAFATDDTSASGNLFAGENVRFSILDLHTNEPLGCVSISSIDYVNNVCELGIAIYEIKNMRKGYARDAVKLMLDYAFMYKNIHRVEAQVLSFNIVSIRFMEEIGFRQCGELTGKCCIAGSRYDVILFEYLINNWERNKSSWFDPGQFGGFWSE